MGSNKKFPALIRKMIGNRRLGIFAAGVGIGTALVYLLLKRGAAERRLAQRPQLKVHTVDDRGTGQEKALQMLHNLRDRAFDSSDERLALALGRPREEVEAWAVGRVVIDDDVVMKARGIAMLRGVNIE